MPWDGTAEGKEGADSEPPTVSTQRQRIAKLARVTLGQQGVLLGTVPFMQFSQRAANPSRDEPDA